MSSDDVKTTWKEYANIPIITGSSNPILHNPVNFLSDNFCNSEKKQKIYRKEELFTIGMPCGGIAAGHIYVRGDGTVARFYSPFRNNDRDKMTHWTMHHESYLRKGQYPYGYRTIKPEANIKQGFLITCQGNQDPRPFQLTLDDNGFSEIGFIGEYPIATILYEGAREPLFPLTITADVFSPFIPHDLRASANPCTIFHFKVKNNTKEALTVNLAGWLENAASLTSDPYTNAVRVNTVKKMPGMASVFMNVVEKKILSDAPSLDTTDNVYGDMTISVLDDNIYAAAAVTDANDNVDPSDYALMRMISENLAKRQKLGCDSYETHIAKRPCGYTASSFLLSPGSSHEITFVLSWYFPNYQNDWPNYHGNTGRMYTNWYSSSYDVASYIKAHFNMLYQKTKDFRDTYFNSTLPYWFLQRCEMSASTLASHTIEWWKNNTFHAMEGVGFCFGAPSHVWEYIQTPAYLFPEIERNFRKERDIKTCLHENGRLNFREFADTITDETNLKEGIKQWYYAADGQCGTILRFYREHLLSSDLSFLKDTWPFIKKMISYLMYQDKLDGTADGMITVPQHNTSDGFLVGANTYTGSAYLAALRACEEMAHLMKEDDFAATCHDLFLKGQEYALTKLWNGEYFINVHSKEDESVYNAVYYNNGCHIDQLFGQTWAFELGLGYLYPESYVKKALQSIFRYNFSFDQSFLLNNPETRKVLGSQTDPGDSGLCTVSYPKCSISDSTPNYWYSSFTWTGFEYHVAALMLAEGMINEGLTVYHAIDKRYDGIHHNPFNEIEGGDHYTRAMAAWGGLLTISGFCYNGPEQKLCFFPKITPENFRCFFSTGCSWGSVCQLRTKTMQSFTLTTIHGITVLKEITLSLPQGYTPVSAFIISDSVEYPLSWKLDYQKITCVCSNVLKSETEIHLVIVICKS